MSDTPDTMWVKGYVNGFQVSFTLALPTENFADWLQLQFKVLQDAGVSPRELGTEPGEDVHTLDFVVRRTKKEKDGNRTPIIDLYSNRLTDYRVVGLYLNNEEDVAKFERATGLKVASLREYPAKAPLERKEDAFADYASAVPTLPQFAIKKNPKWNDNIPPLENDVAKHLFTRWLGAGAPAPVAESKSERLAREIDNERPAHLKPGNPVLTDKQFIATAIQKKAKGGKEWYVLFSEDKSMFATTWGLSEYGVFSEEEHAEFDDYEEHEIDRTVVTWKLNKEFKNVTALLRLKSEFDDIPF